MAETPKKPKVGEIIDPSEYQTGGVIPEGTVLRKDPRDSEKVN